MTDLSPLRKHLVIMASLVACLSGMAPLIMRHNHLLGLIWLGIMAAALVYVFVITGKLKDRSDG